MAAEGEGTPSQTSGTHKQEKDGVLKGVYLETRERGKGIHCRPGNLTRGNSVQPTHRGARWTAKKNKRKRAAKGVNAPVIPGGKGKKATNGIQADGRNGKWHKTEGKNPWAG